jgi:hypothetical protein
MTLDLLVAPERVMEVAANGRLSKHALGTLLSAPARRRFFEACARIETAYTEACRAEGDPCLESGCSMEGERCLQPLVQAGTEYYKKCGAEWNTLFTDPVNRDPSWRMTLSGYEIG